ARFRDARPARCDHSSLTCRPLHRRRVCGHRPDPTTIADLYSPYTMSPLDRWENFYVIIGSSAAALTGLQFVVIALVAEMRQPSKSETIDAFCTPTIVHFCVAPLLSAILSAPWKQVWHVGFAIAAIGFAGLAYAAIIVPR